MTQEGEDLSDGDDTADSAVRNEGSAKATGPDLSRLAHELRTPLSAIAMLSEIMRDERLGRLEHPRYRAYAADIHDSAGHAMSVLSSLLESGDSSADRSATLPMNFVELDLFVVAAGSVSALIPMAERFGVNLSISPNTGLPKLIADRRSLRQILNNLITNALKFTPPGGNVSVSLAYEVGGALVLMVTDTGDGMTAVELTRARSGTTSPEPIRRRSGGTGYGLPLVRALASASGATLSIDSTLRCGTRVCVAFAHDHVLPV